MLLHELLVMTHSGMHYSLKCKRDHLTVLSLMKHKKCFHKCLFVCLFLRRKCTVEISCNLGDLSRRLKNCGFSIWCLSEASDSKEYLIWKTRNCSKNQTNKLTKKTHNESKQEKPTNKQKTQKQKSKQKRKERKHIYILLARQGPEHFPHNEYKPQSLI